MVTFLKNTDTDLFLYLNGIHNSFLDAVIPYLTNFWVWIPLFAWWLYLAYKKHKQKTVVIAVFAVALIFFTDQGSGIIKKTVKRARPTHNTEISSKVHTVNDYKGGEYGFVSSHAANAFGIAIFLFLLMRPAGLIFNLSLFIYACVTCYTRIYLGVHYPLDILGGALLGSVLAVLFFKIHNNYFK